MLASPKRPGPGKQFLSTFFHTQILFSCKYFRGYKVRDRLLLFWRKEKKKFRDHFWWWHKPSYFRNKIFIYLVLWLNTSKLDKFLRWVYFFMLYFFLYECPGLCKTLWIFLYSKTMAKLVWIVLLESSINLYS